ncbi:MAG TPA: RidA family protein [Hyphomicrobiaceae bacterium]|nr:RidA family protein [Hyphomicrobiaceae bacterium]
MSQSPINRRNIQPEGLHQRRVNGLVLYSHVVTVEPRKLVFISGQLARDAKGSIVGAGDMRAQIRQALTNIKIAVEAAGGTLADLVRTNTYVTDIDEYFKHVDVRMEFYRHAMPTSTTVEVRRLAHPDLMVEIDAIAALG